MPGGDRTGPQYRGPMTGRGFGYCAGNDDPGYMYAGAGRFGRRAGGTRFGRGLRRGFGRGFVPEGRARDDAAQRFADTAVADLRNEIAVLRERLESLSGRVETADNKRREGDYGK